MIALLYYLIKVVICSGILFLYYHLALRNKIFHQWNRFYLLAVVILSLTIPLAQFTFIHGAEKTPGAMQLLQVVQSADNYMEEIYIQGHRSVTTEQWIESGYILVSLFIFITVVLAFVRIYLLIKKHQVQLVDEIKVVSTEVKGTPFSFFHYIFWNAKIDINSPAGRQIFQHELVHIKDAHTYDKLFMQLTLVGFWCNPFFWLIRKELNLIHEFIADKKSIQHKDTAALAAMILQAAYPHQYHAMTNQFFQSSIKRRILMLTKIKNPRITYFSRMLALPIIAFVILAFTVRTKFIQETKGIATDIIFKKPGIENVLFNINDTLPKIKKEIKKVDVNKSIKTIVVTYTDGTSEVMTVQEANKKGLLQNGGVEKERIANKKENKKKMMLNENDAKPLYVADGKELKEPIYTIDPKMIHSIDVLKGKTATDKYGEKGKNGVVEITMKKTSQVTGHISIKPAPVYFLDGKQVTKSDVEHLDMKSIESVNILNKEGALEKYGEIGRNGVVEITLKKTNRVSNLTIQDNGKPFMYGEINQLEISNDKSIKFKANLISIPDSTKNN